MKRAQSVSYEVPTSYEVPSQMTENRHKQRQRLELLFQQTEFSEPANMVSQPVQPVERGSQNLPKPS